MIIEEPASDSEEDTIRIVRCAIHATGGSFGCQGEMELQPTSG